MTFGLRAAWFSIGLGLCGPEVLAAESAKPDPLPIAAGAPGAAAAVKGAAAAERPPVAAVLRESATHAGVGIERQDDTLRLYGCRNGCDAGLPHTNVSLPNEVAGGALSSEVLSLGQGVQILFVRVAASDGRTYAVLARGAAHDDKYRRPVVLLRGFTGGESGVRVEVLKESGKAELVVSRRQKGTLCGRDGYSDVKRFDAERGEFVAARLPPFTAAERKQAPTLEPSAAPLSELLAIRPSSAPGSSERSLVLLDGSASGSPIRDPWGALVLDLPSGTRALVVERAAGGVDARNGGQLWLLVGSQLLRVPLPLEGMHIELPLSLAEKSCVALISDGAAAPLESVAALVDYAGDRSMPGLVVALDGEATSALAGRALLARRQEGAQAVADGFTALGPEGRTRALDLAPEFVGDAGAEIELRVFLTSPLGPERTRATDALVGRGPAIVPRIAQAIDAAAPASEMRLLELLARLSPEAALNATIAKLDQKSAVRRRALRDFFAALAKEPTLVAPTQALVASQANSRRVQIEIVRALVPAVPRFSAEARLRLVALLGSRDFGEQYLLLEPALSVAGSDAAVAEQLRNLADQPPASWTGAEREAWLIRELEGFADSPVDQKVAPFAFAQAERQLAHASMRVRLAAARLLGQRAAPGVGARLVALAQSDAWPRVREEAVRGLGQLGPKTADPRPLESAVGAVLQDDESPVVRRAAARALREYQGESSVRGLRAALEDDTAFGVRAEAALGLGRRCDHSSLERLTELAQMLEQPLDEGQVEVSMAALSALVELSPADLALRLAPLRVPELPGQLKGQIERAVARVRARTCAAAK